MNKRLQIENQFFDRAYCKKIIEEATKFHHAPSPVGLKKGGMGLRTQARNSNSYELPESYFKAFNEKIQAYIPTVEKVFGFKVNRNVKQKIRLLGYNAGHFFKPHRDAYEGENYPGTETWKVTGIIYLNDYEVADPAEGNFSGGEFLVYGLDPGDKEEKSATPVLPEAGQFVLFNSSLIHEVLPIRGGTRYCITTWYS